MSLDTSGVSKIGQDYTNGIVWLLHQEYGWLMLCAIVLTVLLLVIWLSHIANPDPYRQNNNQYQQRSSRGNDPDYW